MQIDDLWYKNAIIYCLDVEKYADSNGDGIGDFAGLMAKLDYLAGLGVTCVWLQPFYPSPNRDNGYDVSDFYGVNPKHGTPGEFVEFMNHAQQRGIRIVVDLVVNHTSIRHPWFQAARKDPSSPYRDTRVNAEAQRRDPHSLLNWMERKIRMRKECPEISWGDWKVVPTNAPPVLAMRYEFEGRALFILHNFSEKPHAITVDARTAGDRTLIDLLATNDSQGGRKRPPHDRSAAICLPLVPCGEETVTAEGMRGQRGKLPTPDDGVSFCVRRSLMKRPYLAVAIAVAFTAAATVAAHTQTKPNADRDAVRQAALDYVEGIYAVQPERIQRSVHPSLVKRGFYKKDAGTPYVEMPMTYDQLVKLAGEWNKGGKRDTTIKEVAVLDVLDQTATAKVTAMWGIDYMLLGKYDGQWKIVQILWQSHPPK